ncbi:MAG TPA: molybdenum cofactor guanylyltransferase [Opitutaceae bacterium]|jgi:molybdopterin-guanine dinucleotide biosynthesis protein A
MLGVVLAGGQGRRMGRDKALIERDGVSLWRRQVGVLRRAGAERVVVIRRREQAPLGHPDCRTDVAAGAGPLAGLQMAFGIGRPRWVAVLAVDMPEIDAAWFAWLRGFCGEGRGAIARHAAGLEPLAAIYPGDAGSAVVGCLVHRTLSVRRFAESLVATGRLAVIPLAAGAAARTESLNYPPA